MWNPFGKPRETEPDPTSRRGDQPVHERIAHHIANVELINDTALATLTVTELSQDEGAEKLADLLQQLADTGAIHFVLDVQNVQYMDSACLGCLVGALNQLAAQRARIALVNPNHSVHYVFRLTRLDRVFSICSDVPAAIETVHQQREAG